MSNVIQTNNRDIAWFKQADHLGQLQMKPPFQRNLVWTTKQKSFLIDTILHGYPVPEIYMQELTNEDGGKEYIVVDGQQRITACLEFVNNVFSIDANDSPSFADLTFEDLKPEQKKKIYSYSFVIRLLPEMSDLELREIFTRLNRNNVILNAQELRQATYWGQFIQTMNEISTDDSWRVLGIFTANDVKRMLDVEFISELTIAAIHGVQNKKLTIDKYYELYEDEFPERDETKSTFGLVNREILSMIPDISKTRWSKKTDFYTLFVLLARKKHLLPLGENQNKQANEILIDFASKVDSYVSTGTDNAEDVIEQDVKDYATNLRASSDLGSRKKREEALERVLAPVLSL
ncbi:DUF262 domain-containing protein [Chitinophaga sp. CC14]|uniref:DUF262 domain-containing protein n=1 Tax=Chitinophaga sp. CC14 TaxID=3029199 RepID=UPI003B7C7AD8